MTRQELNKNILNTVLYIKELKKLKTLKSFKIKSEFKTVLAFMNDTPLRVADYKASTIDLEDIKSISDIDTFELNFAKNIVRELDNLNKEFNNFSFNYRILTLEFTRQILLKIQENKLKNLIKYKKLSDEKLSSKTC